MKRPSLSRRLNLEQLENRRVFAGVVDVSVVNGDLIVRGDDLANGVQIFQVAQNGRAVPGSFFISGGVAGGLPTTITLNGQASASGQSVSGVTDDMQIDLRGGNDRLLSGSINLVVPDDLNVELGEGNNVASLRLRVAHNATINSGNGTDTMFLGGSIGVVANPDSDLTINTRGGADVVQLTNFFVRDDLRIDTGLGEFTDKVFMFTGNVGDDTNINTFAGNDTVDITGVGFNSALTVNTSTGRDTFLIDHSEVDEMFAFLGNGDDHVEITDTFGRNIFLNGGSGDADSIVDPNELLNVTNIYSKTFFES